MELRINIEVNQILKLIRQMPTEHRLKIKKELDKEVKKKTISNKDSGLTELLLSGPIMNNEEKENFKNLQKYFDLWTKTAFA